MKALLVCIGGILNIFPRKKYIAPTTFRFGLFEVFGENQFAPEIRNLIQQVLQ
jgi:hypothetical protein